MTTPAKTAVWPAIIKSLEWLKRQGVIDPARVGGLFTAAQISAAAAGALVDRKMLADLNRELQASAAAGEGRAEWQQRVRKVVTTRAFFEENLHRTLTHQAYHRGIEEVASHPAITDEFPYRLYAATNDARTRKAHAAMDGKVAHRGSPLAKEMQRLADEYNCRCTIILLSREDAVTRGIDDNTGWTEPEKEKPKVKPVAKPKAPTQPKTIESPTPPKASESEIQAKIRELQRLIDQIDPEQERQELAKKGTITEKLAAFKSGDVMLEKMRAAAKEVKPPPEPISWREIDAQVMRETGSANPPDYGKRVDAIRAKSQAVIDAAKVARRDAMKFRDGSGLINGDPPKNEPAVFWRAEIAAAKDRLDQVVRWFTSSTATRITVEVELATLGDGAYAMVDRETIAVTPTSGTRAMIHEIGHIFEHDDGVRRMSHAFREARLGKRLGDIPKSELLDITRDGEAYGKEYSIGEIPTTSTYFTKSTREYMGRVSAAGNTEVVSLGIEAMYDDPIKFAEEDPEYFKFIYGVLRGAFKAKPDTTLAVLPKAQPKDKMTKSIPAPAPEQKRKITLYRAADDDIVTDSASFSESLDAAKEYLSNPGFGGRSLWKTKIKVDPAKVLDLVDEDDPTTALAEAIGEPHPGAIGADEWAPRIASEIADAGYEWVRVKESYPVDSITWIWVGGDDPEMVQID